MNLTLMLLLLSTSIIIILLFFISKKVKKTQISKIFKYNLIFILIWNLAITFQNLFSEKLSIPPIYFDYIAYIGICFLPLSVFFTGKIFSKTKINFKVIYLLLFIIPIFSLLILWTNDFHHLFYTHYSTNLSETEFGPYMTIHNVFSYTFLGLGVLSLLIYSIKNVGFFSKQSILILLGISIPLFINILGTFKIIPMTIYYTPISFAFTILFFFLAIFKFNFLGATPIAMQKIVDRISDSYVVLNEDGIISDFNKTFLTTFNIKDSDIRAKDFITFLKQYKFDFDIKRVKNALNKTKKSSETISFDQEITKINKTFTVEINTISSDGASLGTLVLLKDITQHMIDIQTIQNNQDMLMEQERLASLGQLIGGISHNLKTPIMSISGAAEGLNDLIKEYEASVGDPEVTVQDHHDIAKDMYTWTEKIKSYTEYMSDIITTVKGQAVTLSSENDVDFTIDELIKRVDILMKHELKNALITLNTNIEIDPATTLDGDVNSLVQVVNNLIQNAIQAYGGETNKEINLNINKENNNIIIAVQDFGMGMSDEIKKKLFKEMITTKGKNGSGLGLFMSYSTIKAHFKGDLTFESEQGKGTTFYIKIPV